MTRTNLADGPRDDADEVVGLREQLAAATKALEGVYLTEVNGRLCPLPDEEGVQCCASCRRVWERVRAALEVSASGASAPRSGANQGRC